MTFVLFNYSAKNHPILFLDDMTIDHKKGIFVTMKRSTKKLNRRVLVILALSRCYSSIFDGLVAKKKLSPAPATVSQYPWGIVDSVVRGSPMTISCNANKVRNVKTLRGLTIILAQELETCMFEPPNSPWNNTYVRSGDAVYIKENSRIR